MLATATYRHARIAAQKARLVANQVRGLPVQQAVDLLSFSPKKAAQMVKKVLDSAIANAEHNSGADIDELQVAVIYVDEGRVLKRFRARARGRGNRILKQSCHITVKVAAEQEQY